MIGELGQCCLIMALGFAGVQTAASFYGYAKGHNRFSVLGEASSLIQGAFVGVSFLLLMLAFYLNDYSLLSVALNSHDTLPLLYRLAATWGHHEGSLLLWVLILSLMSVLFILFQRKKLPEYSLILSIQGLLTTTFLAFMIFASSPFTVLPIPFLEGESLNPLLQDRGLALHPPFLYLGYVGMSLAYSFGMAGLIRGEITSQWADCLRPWIMLAWASLSIGVALGSWWAYYELGWGGYWFWDPVENASLMPWLVATALIHTIKVTKKQGRLVFTTVFLSLLTFILSLLGTFLVRSGMISSVHAFATDPLRGTLILWILVFYVTIAACLLLLRGRRLAQTPPLILFSREGAMLLCAMALSLGCAIVILGTFYPLIVELWGGGPLSIGAPYYMTTFVPFMVPLLALMPLGLFMVWQHHSLNIAMKTMAPVLSFPLFILVIVIYLAPPAHFISYMGLVLALWVIAGSALYIYKRQKWGTGLAHMGFGIAALGMVVASTWEDSAQEPLGIGESLTLKNFTGTLSQVSQETGPNYRLEKGEFLISKDGTPLTTLTPEKRLYTPQNTLLSETSIYTNGLYDLYGVLGAYQGDNRYLVRLQFHPLIGWIWWGAVLMALGGLWNVRWKKKS